MCCHSLFAYSQSVLSPKYELHISPYCSHWQLEIMTEGSCDTEGGRVWGHLLMSGVLESLPSQGFCNVTHWTRSQDTRFKPYNLVFASNLLRGQISFLLLVFFIYHKLQYLLGHQFKLSCLFYIVGQAIQLLKYIVFETCWLKQIVGQRKNISGLYLTLWLVLSSMLWVDHSCRTKP